ncbi:MAG: hypothetical protein LC798_11945 [Chloroflexi bacterium]|nr:hypothetical protein [Chloroflexota bacterium]
MSRRVTDEIVHRFLVWARNYEEIESFRKIAPSGRCWRIRIRPGVRADGMDRSVLDDILGDDDRVVPTEIVLTSREALVFGYGCAVAGASRHRDDWTQEDWEAQAAKRREAREREEAREAGQPEAAGAGEPEPVREPTALEREAPLLVEHIRARPHAAAQARAEQITTASCPWVHREWRQSYRLGALHALQGQPPAPPDYLQGSSREQGKRRAYFAGHAQALKELGSA